MKAPFAECLESSVAGLWPGTVFAGGLAQLSGGASLECWRFDVIAEGRQRRLVLRRKPESSRKDFEAKPRIDLATEAKAMEAASRSGAPIPPIRWSTEAKHPLGASVCMDWIEGQTVGPRIFRDPALAPILSDLPRQCGAALARIHAAPTDDLDTLPRLNADTRLALMEGLHARHPGRRPVFDLALAWLERNLPTGNHYGRLVHGDFRTGNLMIGPDGLRAVLDWELAHLGDPNEDLGWFCVNSWRFGRIDYPAGGFGSREDLFAAYEAAGGHPVDPQRVRFWEVMGTLRWGLDCVEFAEEFRRGDRTVERAAIGRRASETELDLLRLIAPRDAP